MAEAIASVLIELLSGISIWLGVVVVFYGTVYASFVNLDCFLLLEYIFFKLKAINTEIFTVLFANQHAVKHVVLKQP